MSRIDVQLDAPVARDFRVEQVAGLFDVAIADRSKLTISVHVPPVEGPGSDWQIGVIAGSSGSGKSSISRAAYGEGLVEKFDWPTDQAIVSAFPRELTMELITGALNAVGFSSPPAWILPYRSLSTGQRMRADLARALLTPAEVLAFDEFTSVVDRQVGRFASAAVSKAIRKERVPLKRFVAVTCHHDVIQWLEPDWVLDLDTKTLIASPSKLTNADLPRGSLQCRDERWRRPPIDIEVRRSSGSLWPVFERHHYLSAAIHPAARCYAAMWENNPIALCATLMNAGHIGRRIVHRLVVLPDYQGLGVGLRLLDVVSGIEHNDGSRISIRTSHPALIRALKTGGVSGAWMASDVSRGGQGHRGKRINMGVGRGSLGRSVVTFNYRPGSQK